jgi:hypothetical protein
MILQWPSQPTFSERWKIRLRPWSRVAGRILVLSLLFAFLLTAASLLGPGLARSDRGVALSARSGASSSAEHIRSPLNVVLMAARQAEARPEVIFDAVPETNLLFVSGDWFDPTEEVAALSDATPVEEEAPLPNTSPVVLDVGPTFGRVEAANPNVYAQYAVWSELRVLRGQDHLDFTAFRDHLIAIGAPDPGSIG